MLVIALVASVADPGTFRSGRNFSAWIGKKTLNGPEEEIPVQRLQLFRYMDVPPFYVLCLSSRFDFRMFHDFEADAALVIHDRAEFVRRLNLAMSSAVDAKPVLTPVQYYDSYQVRREELIPGFSKHLRYAYQNEVRMIWEPKSGTTPTAVFVGAGPLEDIAELVRTA
jgi:hypothetical protein